MRWFRHRCWGFIVWFIIISAVIVSVGRLLSPYADEARPLIERLLSRALNQPVQIDRVEASWPRLSPQIQLLGVELGEAGQHLLSIERARLELKLYNLVRPGSNSFELAALGLDLAVTQDEQGGWSWELERGGQFADGWERSLSAGDFVLRDSGIRVSPHGFAEVKWEMPRASLNRSGDRLEIQAQAQPENGDGGMFEARMLLQMAGSRLQSLRGFAESGDFAFTHLPFASTAEGIIDLRAQMQWWFEWKSERGGRLHGRVDLHSLAESGIAGRSSSRFELDGRWGEQLLLELNARELGDDDSNLIDGLAYGQADGNRVLMADRIELEYLHAVMEPWLASFTAWPAHMTGTVDQLSLALDADGTPYQASGTARSLELDLKAPMLSLTGAELELALDGDWVLLRPSGGLSIDYPFLYPRPVQFSEATGQVGIGREGFRFEPLRLNHEQFEMVVAGAVWLHGRGPFIDLAVNMPRLSPDSPQAWLPESGLSEKSRNWLQDALLKLDTAASVSTLFGYPQGWKQGLPHGAVHSVVEFSGLDLDYAPGWPVARELQGRVAFLGHQLDGVVETGLVAGVGIAAPRIHIPDRRDVELELTVRAANADAAGLAELARALPVDRIREPLAATRWQGPANAQAKVWLPLERREDWQLAGRLDFQQVDFELRRHGIGVAGLSGRLPFSRKRFGPATLTGRMVDQDVRFELDARTGEQFRMSLSGDLPVGGLLPASWRQSWPELEHRVTGRSHFEIGISGSRDEQRRDTELTIASELDGIELDFPMPLFKPASKVWPFESTLPLSDQPQPAVFRLGRMVNGKVLADPGFRQVGIGLGQAEARLPSAENFVIEGGVDALQLDQLVALLEEFKRKSPAPQSETAAELNGWANVEIGDLRIGEKSLDDVELALRRDGDYWHLDGSGPKLGGAMRFPASRPADRNIVIDLDHLHWPAVDPDQQRQAGPPGDRNPQAVPAFDIAIDDLHWGELELGETRVTSHNTEQGIEIEQFSINGDGLQVSGGGRWIGGDEILTELRLRLASDDLGGMLRKAGFTIALERGEADIEFDGQWPGGPTDFALKRVSGDLDIVIGDGSIPEAGPGAGRVLGLVSLNSIPRRLRLDFSDVFGGGLAFDRVAGHFDLSEGVARTDDLRIDAPSAEVRIEGETDLKAQTYDQVLTVRPGVGSALPIIGALAGGPVGAAAGAALQQILDKPLKGVSKVKYSVTGTWQEPVIEPISVRPADPEKKPVELEDGDQPQ